jgi:hypothetical protein
MKRLVSSVTAGCFLLVLVQGSGAAYQEATPAVLGAEHCTVEPIDPVRYMAAIEASIPPLSANPFPVGTPADDATIADVTAVIEESIACTNVGDLGRLLAVLDPAYAPTLLGVPYSDLPAALEAAAATSMSDAPATPLVDDVDQGGLVSTLLGITNVQMLEDGSVSAEATVQRTDMPTTTFTIYLKFDDALGRYLITTYAFHYAMRSTPVS